jgi:hypothetical protein
LRQLKENKVFRRIEVIFAAFIDDPNVTIEGGVLIRQYSVNLMQFQRRRIVRVADADGELAGSLASFS